MVGETHRTHQRDQEDDGETDDIWYPTRFSVFAFVFDEHAINFR